MHFLRIANYDACVLDLGLPDREGLGFLRELRGQGRTLPILIVTARDGTKDVVTALDNGADDYLIKPFFIEELIARLRALLRRPSEAHGARLALGNIELDISIHDLRVSARNLYAPKRELAVLHILLKRSGNVVAKRAIEEEVYALDRDVSVNALEATISRLRKRLAEAGANVAITSTRGVGYMIALADTP